MIGKTRWNTPNARKMNESGQETAREEREEIFRGDFHGKNLKVFARDAREGKTLGCT